jgi:hypothetical protein
LKLLLRVLWLLLGLLYRLVVLVLFERWIPFPERSSAEQPRPQTPRARAKQRREPRAPTQRERQPRGQSALPAGRRAQPLPIFELRAGEPRAELVAALESEHLAPHAHQAVERPRAQQQPGARPLRALLRDKRALAGAIVLGEAFVRRRPASK